MGWYGYDRWKPYVPVARRRAKAQAYAAKLAKKERRALAPVQAAGRIIARSFWGQAWCQNLERYSDFANRLPRGRTYLRNGSVIDLQIERGQVRAIVSGSEIYKVAVKIKTLSQPAWKKVKHDCSRSISSLIDLLQGRFDEGVMRRLTQPDDGLFPQPAEIEMTCSCPDWAGLCKHVAATLYGIGARLDAEPELLFTLRDVDHLELVSAAAAVENLDRALVAGDSTALAGSDLGEIFGIELDTVAGAAQPAPSERSAKRRTKRSAVARGRRKTAAVAASQSQAVVAANRTAAAPIDKAQRPAKTARAEQKELTPRHDSAKSARKASQARAASSGRVQRAASQRRRRRAAAAS